MYLAVPPLDLASDRNASNMGTLGWVKAFSVPISPPFPLRTGYKRLSGPMTQSRFPSEHPKQHIFCTISVSKVYSPESTVAAFSPTTIPLPTVKVDGRGPVFKTFPVLSFDFFFLTQSFSLLPREFMGFSIPKREDGKKCFHLSRLSNLRDFPLCHFTPTPLFSFCGSNGLYFMSRSERSRFCILVLALVSSLFWFSCDLSKSVVLFSAE